MLRDGVRMCVRITTGGSAMARRIASSKLLTIIIVGLSLAALLIVAPSALSASATEVQFGANTGEETRALDFGESRDKRSVTLRFLAASPLAAEPEVSFSDLQTSDGKSLEGKLTTKVTPSADRRTFAVRVDIKPSSSAKAGTYETHALLRESGATDARSTLKVTLADKPVDDANLIAVVLLLLGAGLGLFAKWVAGTASTLKGLGDRLASVEKVIGDHQPIPVVFRSNLIQARSQLAAENAQEAEGTLKNNLEGAKVNAAVDVAEKANAIERKITEQRSAVAAMPELDAGDLGRLNVVLGVEAEWIASIVQEAAYDSADASGARAGRLADAQVFSAFLADFADRGQRAALATTLGAFARGEFADAKTKWQAARPAAAAARAPAAAALASELAPIGSTPDASATQSWSVRHAPLLAQGFTALSLVTLGLFTAYDPSTTFRGGHEFLDAVKLFAWGLGSALAGGGVSEIVGKLTAGRQGSA